MSQRIDGRVALITGAARGQGRSHALRLAQAGADIIALDLCRPVVSIGDLYPPATEADLAETVAAVESLGRRITAIAVDVRNIDGLVDAVARGVSELGRLDMVCANAGIFDFGPSTHKVSETSWGDVIDINLTGVFHTLKAAVPHILAGGRGGSIVLVSSTAGLQGARSLVAYSASKHALTGVMRTAALEYGPRAIRVNTVHPGHVSTNMIHNPRMYQAFVPGVEHPEPEQVAEAFARTNVLPIPWIEPIDVSNAVLFLVSDDARYITGTELKVDAGFTLK